MMGIPEWQPFIVDWLEANASSHYSSFLTLAWLSQNFTQHAFFRMFITAFSRQEFWLLSFMLKTLVFFFFISLTELMSLAWPVKGFSTKGWFPMSDLKLFYLLFQLTLFYFILRRKRKTYL